MTTVYAISGTPKFQCDVAKQTPPGTLSASRFAAMYCITPEMMSRYILIGIAGERIEVTEVTLRRHVRRYLTPDQQDAALAFLDKHGIHHL